MPVSVLLNTPKQHSMWAPVGPQLGPKWAPDGPDFGLFGNAAWARSLSRGKKWLQRWKRLERYLHLGPTYGKTINPACK